jgi:hypothetical protein
MADDRERLLHSLRDLRAQLDQAELADPTLRSRVEQTISEIEIAVAPDNLAASSRHPQPSLAQRLSDATLEFEASHPTLSGAVGSVIDALSRMGI